ncbi:hypothetical protein M1523_00845 [Patescibacteria group bacterium]|nr:hypothetical protein [Patescibacteria group bacterium]MCL5091704.1 hypothetical protein [Patescibacteria group bacterium]
MSDVTKASSVIDLTTIIQRYLVDLDKLRSDLKMQRQQYNDVFKNDAVYAEKEDKVKAVTRERTAIKQNLMKKTETEALQAKIQQVRAEIKAAQEALSDYLSEYQRVSGATTIENGEGEVLQIVPAFRLKKKNKFNP